MRVFRDVAVYFFLACTACGESPTSPSRIPDVTYRGMVLSWTPAPGCSPDRPYPGIAGTLPGSSVMLESGVFRALWGNTEQLLIVDFKPSAGVWRVCYWSVFRTR